MTASLAVLIPTRNRPQLAANAIRSLLDQDCAIDIYVSDNSATPSVYPKEAHYLRPPRELSMPEHWDWAVREVLQRSDATHFTVHYDRKISKPRHWGALLAVASQWPGRLITFPADFVGEIPPPKRLWQTPWTGHVFSIRTARVTELLAQSHVAGIAHVLPVLSNCVVPRSVLQSIVDRFGDVCHSTAPDTAFMARFLALYDRYLHYDRATGILYAQHRSNGLGYMRGTGGDFPDYLKTWGDRPWLDAAPIPGLNLGYNMLFHEYELVRRETGDRLPPLDRTAIVDDLGRELRWIAEPATKTQLGEILRRHGWTGSEPQLATARPWRSIVREKVQRLRMKLGAVPSHITGFAFREDEEALQYALKYPRAPQKDHDHLAVLQPESVQ